jgi:membrane protein implicated in regulation of membrane protease activity
MQMLWWHWIAIGMILAVVEALGPGGFYVIFFAIGALVVGALSLLGMSGPLWVEGLLFSVVSIVSLLVFRKPLLERFDLQGGEGQPVDRIEGEIAVPTEDIAPGAVGRAELRGTVWSARNTGTTMLARGQRCVVVRMDGFTLSLVAEGA